MPAGSRSEPGTLIGAGPRVCEFLRTPCMRASENPLPRTRVNRVASLLGGATITTTPATQIAAPSRSQRSGLNPTPDYDGTRIDQIAPAPSLEPFWSPSGANARSRTNGQEKTVLSHDVPSPSPCHHVHNTHFNN